MLDARLQAMVEESLLFPDPWTPEQTVLEELAEQFVAMYSPEDIERMALIHFFGEPT